MQTCSLNGAMLQAALANRGWTKEYFVRVLKANGYQVEAHKIQKWCDGRLLPSIERIRLIEAILGESVSVAPPPRRSFHTGPFDQNIMPS